MNHPVRVLQAAHPGAPVAVAAHAEQVVSLALLNHHHRVTCHLVCQAVLGLGGDGSQSHGHRSVAVERIVAGRGAPVKVPRRVQRITLTTSPLWRITMEVKEGWNPLALRTAPAREVQWVMQDAASGVEPATTVKSRVLVVAMGVGV